MDGRPAVWVLGDAPQLREGTRGAFGSAVLGGLEKIVRDFAHTLGAEVARIGVADAIGGADIEILASWGGAASDSDPAPLPSSAGFIGRALALEPAAIERIDPADACFGSTDHARRVTHGIGVAIRPPTGHRGALWAGFAGDPTMNVKDALWLADSYARMASICMYDGDAVAGLLESGAVDGLTGCLTHSAFHRELAREIARTERHGLALSCCFIDLDRFKRVNDRYGHLHGSRVLANLASVLRAGVRAEDSVGRYGGDEFVLLLPNTDEAAAGDLAQRLRLMITTTMINLPHDPINTSIGVAQRRAGQTADELLREADRALMHAKAAGGGMVVRTSDTTPLRSDPIRVRPVGGAAAAQASATLGGPAQEGFRLAGLTGLERALVVALAAGPRTPVELERVGDIGQIARALVWLEHLGLARMAGSHDFGAWMLTGEGRARL